MLLQTALFGVLCVLYHSSTRVNAYAVSRDQADSVLDLPYNFTLAAWNTSLPNANSTGVPLVLGQNGATSGMSLQVTSTWASYPYNDFPLLSLVGGRIRAYTAQGEWITNATGLTHGYAMGWITTRLHRTSGPPANYAASAPRSAAGAEGSGESSSFPLLYGLGTSDLWSLCPFGSDSNSQTNVVFNASAVTQYSGYEPANCYPVRLHIVRV